MGVWKRTKSGRFSEEELAMFDAIQKKTAPFARNWTQTVVMCAKIVWHLMSTEGMLTGFMDLCLRLQCKTVQDTEVVNEFQYPLKFPPAMGYDFRPRIWRERSDV